MPFFVHSYSPFFPFHAQAHSHTYFLLNNNIAQVSSAAAYIVKET
jgi:hypothetical protein